MKTSGHFYYAVCKIYRFGQAREIQITYSLSRRWGHYRFWFLFFPQKNADIDLAQWRPQVYACRPATQRRQLDWQVSSECTRGWSQTWQGPIWWKGRWCGRCAYSRYLRECSEGWWVKTGWTHPVGIFSQQFTGPGIFLLPRERQILYRVPLFSVVAGPAFWCQSLFLSCGGQPTPWPAPSSRPPHSSDSLSHAKVCGAHRLTPSCAILIFWTTAQGSSCWFVRFLEDTVSSKPEVGQLSLKNPSGNINILGLHVKRENSRILSGGYIQTFGASPVALMVENPPAKWETWVPSLGWEDLLEEKMATRSIAWRISMDRGAPRATVHVVRKSQTWLSN